LLSSNVIAADVKLHQRHHVLDGISKGGNTHLTETATMSGVIRDERVLVARVRHEREGKTGKGERDRRSEEANADIRRWVKQHGSSVSEEHLLGCSLRQRLKWLRAQQIKYERKRVQAAQRGLRRDTRRQREWRDTEWIGGRPPPTSQPTIEQMLRGGLATGAAVSAEALRARRRVGEGMSELVAAPWIADSIFSY
jgi:hypothetical protein